jgi:hypothetical protein
MRRPRDRTVILGTHTHISAALLRLVEHLDNHTVPIDYTRRRRLDYRRLLPSAQFQHLCRAAGVRPGPTVRWQVARSILFEQISGTPAHLAGFSAGIDLATLRRNINTFPTTLPPPLAEQLQLAAADFLARNGVRDEPVTWSPPLDLADGLDLPGLDIRQLDLSRLHQLIGAERVGAASARRQLGISKFAVHTMLLRHPAPRAVLDRPTEETARELLTPPLLRRYHLDENLTLEQIDRRAGLARGTASRLASEYGIPVRGGKNDPTRSHPALPRAWMLDQYLNHHRSLADLAREKGMAKSTLRHWAKIYHVPIQRHRAARMNIPAAAAAAPPLLRPAITGPNAWQRLHRFADATRHATFRRAAAALGIHSATLIDHVNRLEHEFGQPLLKRSGRRRVMRPTVLGQQVVAAVRATHRPPAAASSSAARYPQGARRSARPATRHRPGPRETGHGR